MGPLAGGPCSEYLRSFRAGCPANGNGWLGFTVAFKDERSRTKSSRWRLTGKILLIAFWSIAWKANASNAAEPSTQDLLKLIPCFTLEDPAATSFRVSGYINYTPGMNTALDIARDTLRNLALS